MFCWNAFNSATPLQPVSCKVIITNFALGTAAEVQEFSLSQKFATSAKKFLVMPQRLAKFPNHNFWVFECQTFQILCRPEKLFFLQQKSYQHCMYTVPACFLIHNQSVPQHSLSFLGFHWTYIWLWYCDDTYENSSYFYK